jgi:glycosyltransferase involved in cell wall biosynthesis
MKPDSIRWVPAGRRRAAGRRVRVLVAIKGLGSGGAERLLADMVEHGDHEAFDYEVAFVLSGSDALVPAITSSGTRVHDLGARSHWDLGWLARLRCLLREQPFDIVHFHLPYTAALGRLVTRSLPSRARPAVVYTEHSLWDRMAVLVRALNRATIGLDQALVVVSQPAHEALPRSLRARARVVVHGVDLSRSRQLLVKRDEVRGKLRASLGVPDGDCLAVTVANLRPEKGYDTLIEAARRLVERGVPVRFAAAGSGPLGRELAEAHSRLGLGERFRFLGSCDDTLELLAGADLFVLASRQEGLPVALMEATSLGLPIVATAVGGVPQVLTDGVDGLLVPPFSPERLASSLERLVRDPALGAELGQAAMSRSAMFDVASASRQIERIYGELVGAA